jgi:hypothetical protein
MFLPYKGHVGEITYPPKYLEVLLLMGHDPFVDHIYEVKSSLFWYLIHKHELKLEL